MGSVFGGGKGGGGDAAPQVASGDRAVELQNKIYEESKGQTKPWYEGGKASLGTLLDRLGLSGNTGADQYGSLLKTFSTEDFQKDPGYDFRLGEGNKAISRQLAASGKYLTPSGTKALTEYGQNFASNEFNNAFNRYNINQDSIYNRLAGTSGAGQTATGQLAALGSNYANAVGDIYMGQGNAQAAAQQAANNRKQSFFNTLVGAGATAYAASDKRLKENIEPAGQENGHNVYSFNYIGKPDERFIGVMAQEVQETNPEAVMTDNNGLMSVDYSALGVNFRRVEHAN